MTWQPHSMRVITAHAWLAMLTRRAELRNAAMALAKVTPVPSHDDALEIAVTAALAKVAPC